MCCSCQFNLAFCEKETDKFNLLSLLLPSNSILHPLDFQVTCIFKQNVTEFFTNSRCYIVTVNMASIPAYTPRYSLYCSVSFSLLYNTFITFASKSFDSKNGPGDHQKRLKDASETACNVSFFYFCHIVCFCMFLIAYSVLLEEQKKQKEQEINEANFIRTVNRCIFLLKCHIL